MENELIIRKEPKPLTAVQVLAQVRLIQEVMSAVMKEGHHYGIIPGTPKPTLYKPGAEKLLSTFQIGADPTENIMDLSTEDEIRYRVAVRGFSQTTGVMLGVGIGECSSGEDKYKWRKPVCEEEFSEAPTDRKRTVWKKGERAPYQQKQVRMNPVDIANTILKMAKKRALIDMTLTITAASDIFDQDIEDLPDGMEMGDGKKPPLQEPQKKTPEASKEGLLTVTAPVVNIKVKEDFDKNKKPYTLYTIVCLTDGKEVEFKTFSKSIYDVVDREKDLTTQFKIQYKTSKFGNDIESLSVVKQDENAQ